MTRVRALLLGAIVILPPAACADDPVGSTGEFGMAHAWIEGTVLDADLEPPLGVSATIAVFAAGCEGDALTRTSPFLLGFDGGFRILVVVPAGSETGFSGCVRVEVGQPGAPAPIGGAQRDGVAFASEEAPAPTVEIDVRLPGRA